MNATNQYPEIANGNARDTRDALNMAYLNFDSLTEAGQADLLPRMRAMHARLYDLGQPVDPPADMVQRVYDEVCAVNGLNAGQVAERLRSFRQFYNTESGPDAQAFHVALKERARRLNATAVQQMYR